MGRLILGILVAAVAVMLLLAIVHAVLYLFFWLALLAVIAFGVFRIGRWSGRRSGRQHQP